MHLHALEAVDLPCLADLRLHREDLGQDFADGHRIGNGGEQDPALFDAAHVRPFVVDELAFRCALDGTELESPLAEEEIGVDLGERAERFGARQQRTGLAEILVPGLELNEMLGARVHAGRPHGVDKKIAPVPGETSVHIRRRR